MPWIWKLSRCSKAVPGPWARQDSYPWLSLSSSSTASLDPLFDPKKAKLKAIQLVFAKVVARGTPVGTRSNHSEPWNGLLWTELVWLPKIQTEIFPWPGDGVGRWLDHRVKLVEWSVPCKEVPPSRPILSTCQGTRQQSCLQPGWGTLAGFRHTAHLASDFQFPEPLGNKFLLFTSPAVWVLCVTAAWTDRAWRSPEW